MVRRWWFVLVFALGCGGASRVRPRGPTFIEKIVVEGNHAIPDDDLVPHLALDRTRLGGRGVDPYQLGLDTDRVRSAYLRKGFFSVQVTSRVEGDTGPQQVVFEVVEGPRAKTKVVFENLPPEIPEARARSLVELTDGSPFDYELFDLAKEELTRLLQREGYAYVELLTAVTDEDGIATARYTFEPGPRCTFGKVTIYGTSGDLKRAIEQRSEIVPGAVFSTTAIENTQRALYDLGRFSTVRVDPDLTAERDVIPIRVAVTRGSRGELKIGGGAAYDRLAPEVRARFGISHIPRALPLWTFGIDARVAVGFRQFETGDIDYEPRVRVLGTAQRIDFLRSRWIGDLGAGLDYLTFEAYTVSGPIAQAGLTVPIMRRLNFRAGWAFAYQSFSNLSAAIDAATQVEYGLERSRRLGTYQQSLVADFRDVPNDVHKGVYLGLRLAEGTPYAGGEYTYLQVTPDLRGYIPLGGMVLALHARGGTILGDVPATERYFAGGVASHRGFYFRELAPSVSTLVDGELQRVTIGGTAALETSIELRATLGEVKELPIVGSVFLDGADVVNDLSELGHRQLHWATGIGAGILVGGFKVRVDIGYRLNRKGPDEPSYESDPWSLWPPRFPNTAFHLGIGDAF